MFCPGCFKAESRRGACPKCGYDSALKRSSLLLSHCTQLGGGKYVVGRLLGKLGGFGVTYLAYDQRLQTLVAIKEYLPRDIATRDASSLKVRPFGKEDVESFKYGLSRFLDEARTLAKIDHPNVVRVRDFLEENGTAYLVMDYCEGLTLSEFIKRQPTGRVDERTAVAILLPILDGLREVHRQGFLHRDIKPQNIYLTAGNRPILLDFGAARLAYGDKTRSMSVVLSEGYAPVEQYQRNGKQGTWTDVYGAAATLYAMLTGKAPPNATDRVSFNVPLPGLHSISPQTRRAIEEGMALAYTKRLPDIEAFQGDLTLPADKTPTSKSSGSQEKSSPEPCKTNSSNDLYKFIFEVLDSSYLVPLVVALGIILVVRIWLNLK